MCCEQAGVLRDFDPTEKLLDLEFTVDEIAKGLRVMNTLLARLLLDSMKRSGATEAEQRAMRERIDNLSDGGRFMDV